MRARDVDVLRAWYTEVLGIEFGGDNWFRFEQIVDGAGMVLGLFEHDSSYIGDPEHQGAMVNFVVDDLEGVVARLAEAGAPTEPIQVEEYGSFTWSSDPEGNRFEMWEPTATATA